MLTNKFIFRISNEKEFWVLNKSINQSYYKKQEYNFTFWGKKSVGNLQPKQLIRL